MDNLNNFSIPLLSGLIFILLAILIFLRGFRMPSDFNKREKKRSYLRKRLKIVEDEKLVWDEEQGLEDEGIR